MHQFHPQNQDRHSSPTLKPQSYTPKLCKYALSTFFTPPVKDPDCGSTSCLVFSHPH